MCRLSLSKRTRMTQRRCDGIPPSVAFAFCPLLWVGQVFSSLSCRLYAMAILWLALKVSGSAADMSATALLENLPLIAMGIYGGVLVDRWDRLRTLAWLDGIRMVLVLSIPVAIFCRASTSGTFCCWPSSWVF